MTDTMQEMRVMGSPRPGGGGCTAGTAVDAWLRRDLADRYDAVLGETLPPELLALLAEVA
jgi:hypothetical protein